MFDYKQKRYYDTGCQEHRCSLCHFSGPVHFILRGISQYSLIDRQYIFIPQNQKSTDFEFIGYTGHKINWDDEYKRWAIVNSISYPSYTVGYVDNAREHPPFGRHMWHFFNNINDSQESKLELKLTKVYHNKSSSTAH